MKKKLLKFGCFFDKRKIFMCILLVSLFGFLSCGDKPSNTSDAYFYYEVENKTSINLEARALLYPLGESNLDNFITKTDYKTIKPGEKYTFKLLITDNEDSYVALNFGENCAWKYYWGWERQCLKDTKITVSFTDSLDCNKFTSEYKVVDYINSSNFIPENNSNFSHKFINATDQDIYFFVFFHEFEDISQWTWSYDYSTKWIKIPQGETFEYKFNTKKHSGSYGQVFFGINAFSGASYNTIEELSNYRRAETITIEGFEENGLPIIKY